MPSAELLDKGKERRHDLIDFSEKTWTIGMNSARKNTQYFYNTSTGLSMRKLCSDSIQLWLGMNFACHQESYGIICHDDMYSYHQAC